MLNIVVLSGSIRNGSHNTKLATLAVSMLEEMGHKAQLVCLNDHELPIYDADLESVSGIPENAHRLGKLLHEANALFIASPEYNASVSPLLKNAIDWLSRIKGENSPFSDMVCCLAAASPGAMGGLRGLNHLRDILVSIGVLVISQQVSVASAMDAFEEDGRLKNERTADFMKAALESLTQKASALK